MVTVGSALQIEVRREVTESRPAGQWSFPAACCNVVLLAIIAAVFASWLLVLRLYEFP
jgi:hypothetical protein